MKWVEGCMWWGRRKKKGKGGTWVVGKKKKKGKRAGFTCMVGKKGVEKKEEKNFEREKLNWFYLYVYFVLCKV